jgi:hypothetical protein
VLFNQISEEVTLVVKPEGIQPNGKYRRRWKENIKINIKVERYGLDSCVLGWKL